MTGVTISLKPPNASKAPSPETAATWLITMPMGCSTAMMTAAQVHLSVQSQTQTLTQTLTLTPMPMPTLMQTPTLTPMLTPTQM